MYIEPNSTIMICRSVPLDNSYRNTLYWASSNAQYNYFASMAVQRFDRQTYNRVDNGITRLDINANKIYDCNYIMFQNTSYNNKWFYGFITSVEYVNDSVCRINWELDLMQTWFFELTPGQCFVEREHITNDVMGANLVPENIELGEYVIDGITNSNAFGDILSDDGDTLNDWYICILMPANDVGENVFGLAGGIYCGLYLGFYSSVSAANTVIQQMETDGKLDEIIAIYMAPKKFVEVSGSRRYTIFNYQWSINLTNVGGYVPKNQKLFTYPYNFLSVTNYRGNVAEYRYEFFGDDGIPGNRFARFQISGGCYPDSEYVVAPYSYKGTGVNNPNYNEVLSLCGLPTCAISSDYYKAWLAQNKSQQVYTAISSGVQIAAGIGTAAATGGVGIPLGISVAASGVNTALGIMAERDRAKVTPDSAKGSQTSNAMYSLGNFNFGFMNTHITYNFAQRIDAYFDVYGYAVNMVKIPNRNNRPHWNYVKTNNCVMLGDAPADDIRNIENIYDAGITFWKNPSEVGNYSLDNREV